MVKTTVKCSNHSSVLLSTNWYLIIKTKKINVTKCNAGKLKTQKCNIQIFTKLLKNVTKKISWDLIASSATVMVFRCNILMFTIFLTERICGFTRNMYASPFIINFDLSIERTLPKM